MKALYSLVFPAVILALVVVYAMLVSRQPSPIPEKPQITHAFAENKWQILRSTLPLNPTQIDIIQTTETKTEPGRTFAQLLGEQLVLYPRYAKELHYTLQDPDEEYLLMTALMNTDGVTVGEAGATNQMVYYVDEQLGGRGVFLTVEQVEDAARRCFGEDVVLEHGTVPANAAAQEQFTYHPEYGVYTLPQKQPLWYLPLVLTVEEASFDTWKVELVFVRYADENHNAFWGFETQPIARWDMEFHVNFNADKYNFYVATIQEKFGEYQLVDLQRKEAP